MQRTGNCLQVVSGRKYFRGCGEAPGFLQKTPEKRGGVPEPERMQRTGNCLQVVSGRKYSVGSDQAPDLKQKRIECREIEDPERTKKNPAPPEMSGSVLAWNFRAEQPVDGPLDSLFHRTRLYRGNAGRTAGFR